jgi:ABC-type antimicrobial peptide transport system permease subunit
MLFGAVALVLLVACANVASMLLARNARRHGEFGVRIALGATRGHIIRLALSESLLLALGGAIAGLGLALCGVRVLQTIAPIGDARKAAMALDGGVLAFSLGVTVLTAVLAGLPPAFAAMRLSVTDLLRTEGRGTAGSRARHRILRGLIIAQVALAFVLANGAALFSASYVKLLAANEKLATEYVLSAAINLRGERYSQKEARTQFCQQLAERTAALPRVTAAGTTSKLPLEGGSNMNILVNTEVFDPMANRTLAEISSITPGYFAVVGLAVLRGRTLEPGDAGGLRHELAQLDPDLPLAEIRTLQEVVNDATQGQRVVAGLVDFFMAAALGLVAMGLYGTLSYHVLQRTREIGVRVAVGASRRDIVRLVFRQGASWVLAGVLLGSAGALGLAALLRAMIYGVDPLNPVSLLAGVAGVAVAAMFACWLPARKASRVDPIVALRAE